MIIYYFLINFGNRKYIQKYYVIMIYVDAYVVFIILYILVLRCNISGLFMVIISRYLVYIYIGIVLSVRLDCIDMLYFIVRSYSFYGWLDIVRFIIFYQVNKVGITDITSKHIQYIIIIQTNIVNLTSIDSCIISLMHYDYHINILIDNMY